MGLEFEIKYRTDALTQSAIRSRYTGWQTLSMETTYYDTENGALSRQKYTLRKRMENGKAVCTVKTPAGDLGRGEWETECDDIQEAIPTLVALGAPKNLLLLTEAVLLPICAASFTRNCLTVEAEGCTVELALDQGVLLGGGKKLPLCEVEIELKEGSREAATAYAEALADRFPLTKEHKSKFRRALELAKEEDHG